MRNFKKVFATILSCTMALSICTCTGAATGITAEEQHIIDKAKAAAAELGVPETSVQYNKYVDLVEDYLKENDLAASQISGIMDTISEIQVAANVALAMNGVTGMKELPEDSLKSLITSATEIIQSDMSELGITVNLEYDDAGNVKEVTAEPVKDNPPITPSIKGDVNGTGKVELDDAVNTLRQALGIIELPTAQLWASDYDDNGTVTLQDAIYVLKAALGIPVELS